MEEAYQKLDQAIKSQAEKIVAASKQIEQDKLTRCSEYEAKADFQKKLSMEAKDLFENEMRMMEAEENEAEEFLGTSLKDVGVVVECFCGDQEFCLPKASFARLPRVKSFLDGCKRDKKGRFEVTSISAPVLKIFVDYLWAVRLDNKAPTPKVPDAIKKEFFETAEKLNFRMFFPKLKLNTIHDTSLVVSESSIKHAGASHGGWQCITAELPIAPTKSVLTGFLHFNTNIQGQYVEVEITKNPDVQGGLAIGLVGHVPQGLDCHKINIDDGCLYSAGNGLVGGAFDAKSSTVAPKQYFEEGWKFGFYYSVEKNKPPSVTFYKNGRVLGSCSIKPELMSNMYPVFYLFSRGQEINVWFDRVKPK